mgnify:FL=1
MRYPFRLVRVDGRAVGALIDMGGYLATTYVGRDYFAEARRSETPTHGVLGEALPAWIEPSVRATGTVTLGEVQTSDDLPEVTGYSPESRAAWRALCAWIGRRLT